MEDTGYSRRMDPSGRLVVPAKLREALNMSAGDDYVFYTFQYEGSTYLCVECHNIENEIERAKRILREAGITSVD